MTPAPRSRLPSVSLEKLTREPGNPQDLLFPAIDSCCREANVVLSRLLDEAVRGQVVDLVSDARLREPWEKSDEAGKLKR